MDIHRCRFVDYPPSAINALAFSRPTSAGRNYPLKLALGRANGNVELWNPLGGIWAHELTLFGGRDRSVEGLAWTCDPDETDDDGRVTPGRLRLFSIGYSSAVTEWDLVTGLPYRQSSGSHSEVWCLAAQPPTLTKRRGKESKEDEPKRAKTFTQDIATGCADGSVVLLSTAEDSLMFKRYVARTSERRARALSITWRDRDVLAVGFADTSIRIYDARNSKLIRGLSLGGGDRGGPKEKLVWALEFLKDGTLVSGDSAGEVCFWDSKNYGQLQRIQSHEADILCLTTSIDGRSVFTSGMDRRTCAYNRGPNGRWAKSGGSRTHRHDVKAMTSFEDKSLSVIVSGGLDAQTIVTPLRGFSTEYHRRLPYTPQSSPVTSAQRLVVSWWQNQVSIWTVNRPSNRALHDDTDFPEPEYELLSRIALKSEEHITCTSITPNGDLLAVATVAQIKFFHLRVAAKKLKPRKLETPKTLGKGGARILDFSRDSKWLLIVDCINEVHVHRISPATTSPKTAISVSSSQQLSRRSRRGLPEDALNGLSGSYDRTITRTAISDDSSTIAVADLAGYVDVWMTEDPSQARPNPGYFIMNGSRKTETGSDADSDSNSDSDSEDSDDLGVKNEGTKHSPGESWTRSPSTTTLPRLPDSPLLLSFQATPAPSTIQTKGVHSSTTPPPTLLTLTASHQLNLYNVNTGALIPWSLRNPSAILPAQFKVQLDRAIGCLWDVQEGRSRVWVYAAGWLCMFDLLQDLPIPIPTSTDVTFTADPSTALTAINGNESAEKQGRSKKRKRDFHETEKESYYAQRSREQSNKTSGGGGPRRTGEEGGGLLMHTRDVRPPDAQDDAGTVSRLNGHTHDNNVVDGEEMEVEEEEHNDENSTAIRLALLRRAEHTSDDSPMTNGHVSEYVDVAQDGVTKNKSPPFYMTHTYRNILAVVSLQRSPQPTSEDSDEDGRRETDLPPLEVAVIERPHWDLDLGPRFEKTWKAKG